MNSPPCSRTDLEEHDPRHRQSLQGVHPGSDTA